jgi:signal transduction histidine kinase
VKSNDLARDRDELLAMVSHELCMPTNAILGWAEEEGIARGHGGEIRTESDGEGRGATFTVLLRSQCLEEDVLSRGFES